MFKQSFKRCIVCRTKFEINTLRPFKAVCDDIECAIDQKAIRRGQALAKKAKADEKRDHAKKLQEVRRKKSWYVQNAQTWCNRYVRLRDRDMPCISCYKPMAKTGKLGGDYDAGHYRSVGSAPNLRFNLHNIHAQCKYCNNQLAGNHSGYRVGLIARIGLQAVLDLEADQTPKHYTIPDLVSLTDQFKAMCKELETNLERG